MKAAFKRGPETLLRQVELRALNSGEIRVKIDACGLCGTDLHERPGPPREEPFGHEIAGTIAELGPGVAHLKVGERVALDSSTPCGFCPNCKNTRQELCSDLRSFFRLGLPSLGFAEQIIAPAMSALSIGDLEPAVACLQEPLGVAIDVVRLAEITIGSNVLLLGPGPIGLMAAALIRRSGARRLFVFGHKRRGARHELATRFGADEFIDADERPLRDVKFDCPIDRIVVTSPPRTLAPAIQAAAKGAIVSFIGIEYGEGATCAFDANDFHFKKLQLRASFASPALFGPLAVQYLREKVVDGAALVSHRYPLDRIGDAMSTARSDPQAVKVVVCP
jgi:L-iditol 2-dehydrogenase